jgi:hypothetical protein
MSYLIILYIKELDFHCCSRSHFELEDDFVLLSNQLKAGGEIPAKGKRTTLHVQDFKDLSRDVIKVRNYLSLPLPLPHTNFYYSFVMPKWTPNPLFYYSFVMPKWF